MSEALQSDEQPEGFVEHPDEAIHGLKNERKALYIDPHGYHNDISAICVAYVFHEAGSFAAVTPELFGTDRGRIQEISVRHAVRKHNGQLIDYEEVPDHV